MSSIRIVFLSLSALLGGVSGSVAHAAPREAQSLKPSTPWQVDYAKDACVLARAFGEGEDRVLLQMRRYAPGDDFRLSLDGARLGYSQFPRAAKIRFGDDLPEQSLDVLPAETSKGAPAWIFQSRVRIVPLPDSYLALLLKDPDTPVPPPPIPSDVEALANRIHVGRPARFPFILETGSMRAAFAALRKCNDDQITHWGVDPEKYRTQSVGPRPLTTPSKWLLSKDYPASALSKGRQSFVMFRLVVGTDGLPTACHIQDSHHPEDFDKVVCNAMMKRARFAPALDKDGAPMVSVYLNTVYFSMMH